MWYWIDVYKRQPFRNRAETDKCKRILIGTGAGPEVVRLLFEQIGLVKN